MIDGMNAGGPATKLLRSPAPAPEGLREEYTRSIKPALAAESLRLERTLSDLVKLT